MQSRFNSFLETTANITIGYLVALLSQLLIFPHFGINLPLSSNLLIGGWFTLISFLRGYILRRWFNGLHFRKAKPSNGPL